MKVQLVVVQGKPEGKVIPLLGPVFKIGRGENCHLRPNSELVSREHAEFTITANTVVVRDLKSRNGTLVNGKPLTESCTLKDRDLVQVGNLTFAVSIQGAPAAAPTAPTIEGSTTSAPKATAASKPAADSGVGNDDIDSWLFDDAAKAKAKPDTSGGVYGGETVTIKTFKEAQAPAPTPANPPAAPAPAKSPAAPASASPAPARTPAPASSPLDADDMEFERLPEGAGDEDEAFDALNDSGAEDSEPNAEEFIDESNPFYAKKQEPEKPAYRDTSDAASDILRKMLERRRRPS